VEYSGLEMKDSCIDRLFDKCMRMPALTQHLHDPAYNPYGGTDIDEDNLVLADMLLLEPHGDYAGLLVKRCPNSTIGTDAHIAEADKAGLLTRRDSLGIRSAIGRDWHFRTCAGGTTSDVWEEDSATARLFKKISCKMRICGRHEVMRSVDKHTDKTSLAIPVKFIEHCGLDMKG
jgi:hypothetical protein